VAGLVERIMAFRARRAKGREGRRATKLERAEKKARAEAQRLEYKRHTGGGPSGGDGSGAL
jgi:hypothetical protein